MFFPYHGNMQDLLVMKVSAERSDYHQIKYVTSNSFKRLGWTPLSLIGYDLNAILPDQIAKFHSDLWKPSKQTGLLLNRNEMLDMYVKLANGFLSPMSFSVRFDSNLLEGVKYIGFLNFNKNLETKTPGLITRLDGTITGMTHDLKNLFEFGDNFGDCNVEIASAYASLNKIVDFKLKCKTFGKNFNKIIQDKEIMKHWSVKCNWSRSRIVEIRIGDKILRTRVKICDYIVHQMDECIRMVELNFYNLSNIILDHVQIPTAEKQLLDLMRFFGVYEEYEKPESLSSNYSHQEDSDDEDAKTNKTSSESMPMDPNDLSENIDMMHMQDHKLESC